MSEQKVVVDSYAWIEYFRGSKKGEKVQQIIENPEVDVITPSIVIAEVVSSIEREKKDSETPYQHMILTSRVDPLSAERAKKVGRKHALLRQKIRDFGMADTVVLITAEENNAKIITGDPHFKGMREVGLFLE